MTNPAATADAIPFPDTGFGPGRAFREAGLNGRAYVELPRSLVDAAPRWLASANVPGAVAFKPRVFRLGGLVVKIYRPPRWLNFLRPSPAVRFAERHFAALPIPSPRPALACSASRRGPSLLVREFLDGVSLHDAWGRDAAAEAALPAFLAAMETHGLRHGDLHPANLLWDGSRWILLDVDGLRHGLHPARRVRFGQWVRLCHRLSDEGRVEELFRRTIELGGGRDKTDWKEVLRRVKMERERRSI